MAIIASTYLLLPKLYNKRFAGVEKTFLDKFKKSLDTGVAALSKKTRWRGLVLGSGIYVPFISYSCAIVYGISLVAYEGVGYEVVLL